MQAETRTRVITAATLIGIVVGLGLLAAFVPVVNWAFVALGFLLSGICAWEFASFSSSEQRVRCTLYFLTITLAPAICLFVYSSPAAVGKDSSLVLGLLTPLASTFLAIVAGLAVTIIAGRRSLDEATVILRDLLPATLLIGFGGSMLMSIALLPKAYAHVFWFVAVVAANDTAAYFGGRAIGGPKLAPAVSPNKTLSGSLTGLAGGLIVGALLSFLVPGGAPQLIALALGVGITSQIGDLTKSLLKRLHGTKDSGTLLPGHGGVLDRIDGLLLASPLYFIWMAALISTDW